jgi:hypothetical protein
MVNSKDRLKRSFLWRGETPDKVYGGHSIINWPTTCRPKEIGGLGVLDLKCFARALRLRWLWYQWKHRDRAWSNLDLPVDTRDKDLFAASTVVTVGDGKLAKFLTSSWVSGRTPKSIAATLFKKSKRKNITMRKALEDDRWISHIAPLVTAQDIREYVTLWEEVGQIQLQESVEDNIHWCWMADGEYTAKSAYCIQFQGTFSRLKLTLIWKAKAEPKCRFFA